MGRKIKPCTVCGNKCTGRLCRECYERKTNIRHYGSGIKPTYNTIKKEGIKNETKTRQNRKVSSDQDNIYEEYVY